MKMYLQDAVDLPLVRSILTPADDPNALEVFVKILTGDPGKVCAFQCCAGVVLCTFSLSVASNDHFSSRVRTHARTNMIACTHARMYVMKCARANTYAHARAQTHKPARACANVHTRITMHKDIRMLVCTQAITRTRICTCTYLHTYAHLCTSHLKLFIFKQFAMFEYRHLVA